MALPTPLTPAQVGGEAFDNEAVALFTTGPYRGMALIVSKNDPNLQTAIDEGTVVTDPSLNAPPGPSQPVFVEVTPVTVVEDGPATFTVKGSGFLLINEPYGEPTTEDNSSVGSGFGDPTSVSNTEMVFSGTIDAGTAGPAFFNIWADGGNGDPIQSFSIVITASN